jgi:hypothetical protein
VNEDNFLNLFFLIAPERFHFLKFIIEGYDNLGVVSSFNSGRGIVKVRCAGESFHELMELMIELAPQIKNSLYGN